MSKNKNNKNDSDLTEEDLTLAGESTTGDDDATIGDDDDTSTDANKGDDDAIASDEHSTFVTKEGLKKLKDELEEFENVKRKELAQRLKEAISFGDLSENSEYEDAKNEQALLENRIIELRGLIKTAKVITDKKSAGSGNTVKIGSTVTIQNMTDKDEPEAYTIVGATEADPNSATISNESPIGAALLDREKGDEITVQAPVGELKYKILKIS